MSKEARRSYTLLAVALTLVLAVMGWVTATLLRLDAERSAGERAALLEEQVRLSLWRLDSAMTPVLSREAALLDAGAGTESGIELPAPATGVVTRFVLEGSELRLLTQANPTRVADLDGKLHSAELLAERPRGLALVDKGLYDSEADKLALQAPRRSKSKSRLDSADPTPQQAEDLPYALKTQALRNEDEWSQRRASVEDNFVAYGSIAQARADEGNDALEEIGEGENLGLSGIRGGTTHGEERGYRQASPASELQAVWLAGELLLIRSVGEQIEGIWLDWPVLHEELREQIADLLPQAQLQPVEDLQQASTERLLATLPARLEPGTTVAPPGAWSPLRAALVVAWLLVLLAFVGVFALLRASLELAARRATFVSTVTHELRTPLTTFRMYTEMLGEGMVEARKRERYVSVLRREAERLSNLVENVLSYARVESDRAELQLQTIGVGELLDSCEARLRERCERAELSLELELDEATRAHPLRTDPAAVEQILFNLVDNASKYGRNPDEPRVRIYAELDPRGAALCVQDFGPGVAPEDRKRVFEPFTKAKADAHGTKPGVGLGLALSRQLARQLGGDLKIEASGNTFRLALASAN